MKNSTTPPSSLIKVAKKLKAKGVISSAIYKALKKKYLCTHSMAIKIMKLSNINIG